MPHQKAAYDSWERKILMVLLLLAFFLTLLNVLLVQANTTFRSDFVIILYQVFQNFGIFYMLALVYLHVVTQNHETISYVRLLILFDIMGLICALLQLLALIEYHVFVLTEIDYEFKNFLISKRTYDNLNHSTILGYIAVLLFLLFVILNALRSRKKYMKVSKLLGLNNKTNCEPLIVGGTKFDIVEKPSTVAPTKQRKLVRPSTPYRYQRHTMSKSVSNVTQQRSMVPSQESSLFRVHEDYRDSEAYILKQIKTRSNVNLHQSTVPTLEQTKRPIEDGSLSSTTIEDDEPQPQSTSKKKVITISTNKKEATTVEDDKPQTESTERKEATTVEDDEPQPQSTSKKKVITIKYDQPQPESANKKEATTVEDDEPEPVSDNKKEATTVEDDKPQTESANKKEAATVEDDEPQPGGDKTKEATTIEDDEPQPESANKKEAATIEDGEPQPENDIEIEEPQPESAIKKKGNENQ